MALTQTLRCQLVWNPLADPKNHVVNTFHIATEGAATPFAAAGEFATDLETWVHAVDEVLSVEMAGVQPKLHVYNLIEPKPRVPILEATMSALSVGSTMYIREACIVMSYRAEYVSGVRSSRRRGRIYLGPIADDCVGNSNGIVSGSVITTLDTAAGNLLAASAGATSYRWVVYSPTTDISGTGETGMYEVIGGWHDNNVDIQRRRGLAGGTRTTF